MRDSILNPKNLVLVGVFCCVYFVVMFAGGMLGALSPIMIMVGSLISSLISGIVVMLYMAKTPYFGVLTIMGAVIGLGMVLSGHVWYTLITAIITGLIGDTIANSQKYQGRITNPLAYAIFQLWSITPALPIIFNADDYLADVASQMKSPEYAEGMRQLFTTNTIVILAVVTFVVCFGSGMFGMRMLKKHFSRAGVV